MSECSVLCDRLYPSGLVLMRMFSDGVGGRSVIR